MKPPKICWDDNADFYNMMAMMELEYTEPQLDCLNIQPTDTVLDIGCGPGRISTLAAKRAKSVTSLDSAPKMLAHCAANAARMGVADKIHTVNMDWFDVKPGIDVRKHDIVIASRTEAMSDIDGITALANKHAAIVIWANAPSIPELIGVMFKGCLPEDGKPPMRPPMGRANGYNGFFNNIYDLGYDPSVKVMTDGFTKKFGSEGEAVAYLRKLQPEMPEDKLALFAANLRAYLTWDADGAVVFRIETRTCVIWWNPKGDLR
jgi:SAM-dependent methyltransferase